MWQIPKKNVRKFLRVKTKKKIHAWLPELNNFFIYQYSLIIFWEKNNMALPVKVKNSTTKTEHSPLAELQTEFELFSKTKLC